MTAEFAYKMKAWKRVLPTFDETLYDTLKMQNAAVVDDGYQFTDADVATRTMLMTGIIRVYGEIFLQDPRFLWSGFASIAAFQGIYSTVIGLNFSLADESISSERKVLLRKLRDAMLVGNARIFDSIFWVMLALEDDMNLSKFDADSTLRSIANEFQRDSAACNLALFRREQVVTLTPVFESPHLRDGVALLSGAAIRAPHKTIRQISRQLFGVNASFPISALYGPAEPRWSWLSSVVWPAYIHWFHTDFPDLQKVVTSIVFQMRELSLSSIISAKL